MGNVVLPFCECRCQDEGVVVPVDSYSGAALPLPLRRRHRVSFEARPFGMTPAKDDSDKQGKDTQGYVVVDVNRTDASRPAFRLGVRPGWAFNEVNGTGVQSWSLQDIQGFLKELPLPIDIEFELPLASSVAVTFEERPFGLKPLTVDSKKDAEKMIGYEIAWVNPERPAAAQGVSIGWIMSKVGDQDVRFAPLLEIKKLLEAAQLPVVVQFDTPADPVVFE